MTSSLVGSEMCIRDRTRSLRTWPTSANTMRKMIVRATREQARTMRSTTCLLYTSDAADDM
eukprot:8798992-Prorocentrum_lima.AAC.1